MVKEQIIVKEIVETVGDNINQYILEFDSSSLWDYTERKILVNNTFKKLVNIMAEFNNVEDHPIVLIGRALELSSPILDKNKKEKNIFRTLLIVALAVILPLGINISFLLCFCRLNIAKSHIETVVVVELLDGQRH